MSALRSVLLSTSAVPYLTVRVPGSSSLRTSRTKGPDESISVSSKGGAEVDEGRNPVPPLRRPSPDGESQSRGRRGRRFDGPDETHLQLLCRGPGSHPTPQGHVDPTEVRLLVRSRLPSCPHPQGQVDETDTKDERLREV